MVYNELDSEECDNKATFLFRASWPGKQDIIHVRQVFKSWVGKFKE